MCGSRRYAMRFHTFGNKDNKIVVFIHGALTPWQIWKKQIEYFKSKYFVIVPALYAHVEEEQSEFISIEQEAESIAEYILENYRNEIYAVCGLSMGGAIANRLFGNELLKIDKLILDGAPLVPNNSLVTRIMTREYMTIIHNSKKRDGKTLESFKKNFLPEEYLESYLKFADTMSDDSIKNILKSVGESRLTIRRNTNNTKFLFLHGTKWNEMLAKKSARLTLKHYSDTKVIRFKGYAHGELAIYKTEKWIEIVDEFLESEVSGMTNLD